MKKISLLVMFIMTTGYFSFLSAQFGLYRETKIRVHNNTGYKLLGAGTERFYGKCDKCPPGEIKINEVYEITGQGNINIAEVEGTEGWFRYRIDDKKGSLIHFYWDNPIVGSNAYNFWAKGAYEMYFTGGYDNQTVVDLYINKAKPVFVPGFNKDSWLKFSNSWNDIPFSKPSGYYSAIPDVFTDPYTNAKNGMCGGMVYTVRDYFEAKIKLPQMTLAPKDVNDPLFGYIVKRLFASLDVNSITLALKVSNPIYPSNNCNFSGTTNLGEGKAHIMRAIEWPLIKKDIEEGHPSPVWLVPTDDINFFAQHQVLAYGYEVKNGSLVRMYVYDPNQPERDDVYIEFNMDNTCRATPITHNVDLKGRPIHCFFRTNYSFHQPPEEIVSASYLLSYETAPAMVKIPGGTKLIPTGYYLNHYDKPAHAATVNDFLISKTEITVGQYRQFCDKTGRSMPKEPSWGWNEGEPISHISAKDMNAYCAWLSQKAGDKYRLPTLDEWEYAATDIAPSIAAAYKHYYSGGTNINEVACWSKSKPMRVASLKPNKYGVYDMSGNVHEAVNEFRYGYQMCRGGGYVCTNEVETTVTVGGRLVDPVENGISYYHTGFRIVKEIPPPVGIYGKIIIKGHQALDALGADKIKKNALIELSYEVNNGGTFTVKKTGGEVSISDFVFDGADWVATYAVKKCPVAPKKFYILKFQINGLPPIFDCWADHMFNWDAKTNYFYNLNTKITANNGGN